MKKVFVLNLLLCLSLAVLAQIDTSFWFANPRLDPGHMKYALEQKVQLVVVTYAESALVTITRPAQGDTLFRTERLPAHSTRKIQLMTRSDYNTKIETPADGAVHNNGIFVQSSEKVTVYWVSTQSNSEIYTLKGQFGLGVEFVVPMQYKYKCVKTETTSVPYASIEVVASEDDTYVTFKTLVATNLGPAGTYTSPRLNRGQTYAIRAAEGETSAANHLGGTIVTSTRPIAVNTTDDSAASYDCGNDYGDKDLIGEQLVPTSLAGSHYIVASNNSKAVDGKPLHEIVYLYAIEDGTTEVYCGTANGDSLVATISPGSPYALSLNRMTGTFLFTKTNQPFIAFQLTANDGACELSGTVLPSLDCSGSREVSYVPALDGKTVTVTIVTRTEYINSFLVNSDPYSLTAVDFYPILGKDGWSYCSCKPLSLVGKERNIRIVNTMGNFHFGVLDAGGGAASYGYFSNYGAIAVAFKTVQDYYYEGEDVQFNLESSGLLENIWWEGPNGVFGVNDPKPVIPNVTLQDAGRYVVHATHKEGCDILPDTIFLNVLQNVMSTEIDTCFDDSVSIRSKGLNPYEWYHNDDLLPNTTQEIRVKVGEEDIYTVSSFLPGFDVATLADSIDIYLYKTDTLVIWRKEINHLIVGATYRWTVNVTSLIKSTAANKLILHAGDTTTGVWSIQNVVGADNIYVLEFVPKSTSGVFKLLVAKPKDNRAVRLRSMSMVPIISVVEDFTITGRDCKLDPPVPPCPSVQTLTLDTTVCDSLLPMTWRGYYFTKSATYRDTLKCINRTDCDSIIYIYILRTQVCSPEPPVPPVPPEPEDTCLTVLTQRWNDIIAVKNQDHNGGYDFVRFVWYRNNEMLDGENNSYLYIPGNFTRGDVFYVELTERSGKLYRACDFMPEILEYTDEGIEPVTKVLKDGHLYIRRNGQYYDLNGNRKQ